MDRQTAAIVRCAVIGYGKNFNFGRMHGRWIGAAEGLELAAVCDVDPECRANARRDFPSVRVYDSVDVCVADAEPDLCVIVTPHHTHAPIAGQCLRAGKHVLVDKAMATSTRACTEMIETAKRNRRTLAVFHSRRHDGNYRAIRELIEEGAIGQVFHVECSEDRFERPQDWWYSSKKASGGVLFFWGPHAVDWVLNLVPSKLVGVYGSMQKWVWRHVDIADEVRAALLFANGCTALVNFSFIAAAGRLLWRILGTGGAIEDKGEGPIPGATIPGYGEELTVGPCGSFTLRRVDAETVTRTDVAYKDSDWLTYYQDLADHLRYGRPVPVSGEQGRRVVAVMEAVARSAECAQVVPVEFE